MVFVEPEPNAPTKESHNHKLECAQYNKSNTYDARTNRRFRLEVNQSKYNRKTPCVIIVCGNNSL